MKRFLILAALLLSACVTQPEGFREQLASAEGMHTAVLDAVDSSLNAGTISSATAQSVADQADKAQVVLNEARSLYNVACPFDPNAQSVCVDPTAQNKLTVAVEALTALQDYLRAQGAKK